MKINNKIEFVLIFIMLILNILFLIYSTGGLNIMGFTILNDNKVNSPYDFIKEDEISFEESKVIIEVNNAVLSRYEDSGSMIPVLNKDSTGVGFKPKTESDIHVGDIISFWQDNKLIVHRVIEIGKDELGIYFITKGDNNDINDEKIRFEQIDSVLVAIIY